MKTLLSAATVSLLLSVPTVMFAKDFNDLNVGDATCIDVFGPWNKVGTIIDMNRSNQEILVRANNGREKWYPAKKARAVWSCKIGKEAADWLLEKGIETAVSQGESN